MLNASHSLCDEDSLLTIQTVTASLAQKVYDELIRLRPVRTDLSKMRKKTIDGYLQKYLAGINRNLYPDRFEEERRLCIEISAKQATEILTPVMKELENLVCRYYSLGSDNSIESWDEKSLMMLQSKLQRIDKTLRIFRNRSIDRNDETYSLVALSDMVADLSNKVNMVDYSNQMSDVMSRIMSDQRHLLDELVSQTEMQTEAMLKQGEMAEKQAQAADAQTAIANESNAINNRMAWMTKVILVCTVFAAIMALLTFIVTCWSSCSIQTVVFSEPQRVLVDD